MSSFTSISPSYSAMILKMLSGVIYEFKVLDQEKGASNSRRMAELSRGDERALNGSTRWHAFRLSLMRVSVPAAELRRSVDWTSVQHSGALGDIRPMVRQTHPTLPSPEAITPNVTKRTRPASF